jgi:hypothetical protein
MAMSDATTVLVSAKIGAVHLGRDAYVYVRQSTLTQLREHTESLIRQYELRERAVALGWDPHQVRVIDADLGRSGAEATPGKGSRIWSPMSVWVGSGSSSASRSAGWPATTPTGISCWTYAR